MTLLVIGFDLFTIEGQPPRETAHLTKKVAANTCIFMTKIKDEELED